MTVAATVFFAALAFFCGAIFGIAVRRHVDDTGYIETAKRLDAYLDARRAEALHESDRT